LGRPVAECRRDDAARFVQEALWMARDLGLRHREPHPPEEAARPPFTDVTFGRLVRLGACDADRVETYLCADAFAVRACQRRHLTRPLRTVVDGMMGTCGIRKATSSSA